MKSEKSRVPQTPIFRKLRSHNSTYIHVWVLTWILNMYFFIYPQGIESMKKEEQLFGTRAEISERDEFLIVSWTMKDPYFFAFFFFLNRGAMTP